MNFAIQNNMQIFIGLLDIADSAPFEFTSCGTLYAEFMGEAAAIIVNFLNSRLGNVTYGWYLVQEPGLSFMKYNGTDCNSDSETVYFMQLLSCIANATNDTARYRMISPYFTGETGWVQVAEVLSRFLLCNSGVSHTVPQDGVGSFNRTDAGIFFQYFRNNLPWGRALWANVETFMPLAQICVAAPASRIKQQIENVHNYVDKALNWWAYNLPGAPTCNAVVLSNYCVSSKLARIQAHIRKWMQYQNN